MKTRIVFYSNGDLSNTKTDNMKCYSNWLGLVFRISELKYQCKLISGFNKDD